MDNKNNKNTIVFYGQDHRPLEESYIVYTKGQEKPAVMHIADLPNKKIYLKLLKAFLIDLNDDIKKDSVQLIGHSEKEIDGKDNFELYSPRQMRVSDSEQNNAQAAKGQDAIAENTEDTQATKDTRANDISDESAVNDDESAEEKNSDDDSTPRFGNLVGTIRRIYTSSDANTRLGECLKSKEIKGIKDDKELINFLNIIIKFIGKQKTTKEDVVIKLEISSRFDAFNEKKPEKTKHYFLADMLLNNRLNLKLNHKHNVDFDYDSLFDFYMLWLIMKDFKDALLKGFFKKYQRFEKNDRKLRGSIDIARHIKLNAGMDNGCIAYSYRENSLDNVVNHLILSAFDYLREKYEAVFDNNIDNELLSEMNHLKYEIGYPKYSRRELINLNSTPISHPFFSEYRDLQKNCLMILRDEGVSPFGNEDDHISGILYYVPDLWEEYLVNPMNEALNSIRENDERLQDYKISVSEQEEINVFTDLNGDYGHVTYPDYVFKFRDNDSNQEEGTPYFILDAKYKTGWKDSLKGQFSRYLFEDYNKCIRDMGSVGATSTGVVFPLNMSEIDGNKIDGVKMQIVHRFSKYNELSCFYTIPVAVPAVEENDTFYNWQEKMRKTLDNTNELLSRILAFECNQYIKIQEVLQINNTEELSSLNYFEIKQHEE